jgi:hypothetical protein
MSDNLPAGLIVHTKDGPLSGGVDMKRCRATVARADGWGFLQCGRKGVVEECGLLWCKQHTPSVVEAKNAERAAKEKAEWDRRSASGHRDHTRIAAADTALRYFRQQATHDELEAAVNAYASALDAVASLAKKD